MQTSFVLDTGHSIYLVLDEVGSYGPIWREISDGEANEARSSTGSPKGSSITHCALSTSTLKKVGHMT